MGEREKEGEKKRDREGQRGTEIQGDRDTETKRRDREGGEGDNDRDRDIASKGKSGHYFYPTQLERVFVPGDILDKTLVTAVFPFPARGTTHL